MVITSVYPHSSVMLTLLVLLPLTQGRFNEELSNAKEAAWIEIFLSFGEPAGL